MRDWGAGNSLGHEPGTGGALLIRGPGPLAFSDAMQRKPQLRAQFLLPELCRLRFRYATAHCRQNLRLPIRTKACACRGGYMATVPDFYAAALIPGRVLRWPDLGARSPRGRWSTATTSAISRTAYRSRRRTGIQQPPLEKRIACMAPKGLRQL
jgi:hypothetical protein